MPIPEPTAGTIIATAWGVPITRGVNNLLPRYAIGTGGALVLTTAAQDIPNASVLISAAIPESLLVVASFDFQATVAGVGTYLLGQLAVDGTNQGPIAAGDALAIGRATATGVWVVNVGAGNHTLSLNAFKSNANGTVQVNSTQCRIAAIRIPQ